MTGYLLDTNVISETVRPRPEPRVLDWIRTQPSRDLFLSAVTLGELVRGTLKLSESSRARRYRDWIRRDLTRQFDGRILSFDDQAAVRWGEIMGAGDRSGKRRPALDAQIAAIAGRYGLALVTRNVRDFQGMGVTVLNPWEKK